MGPANRAIATFNGVLSALRNPEILLSPLTTQEAVLSSKIEGTQATLDEVLKFEAGETPQQEARALDIQEILNYRAALMRAEDELRGRPFNLNLLLGLHRILLDSVRGRNKGRGVFRKLQNWIGAPGCSVDEADFVPPEPGILMEHLYAWEKYYHADSPDPLVQLAVLHAQFEIIHPFFDGNGRLGRILIPLFLYEKGLLSSPVFYLSSYFERHRDEYIAALRDLGRRKGAWNRWTEFFLVAITRQAEANASVARQIMMLYETLKPKVITLTRSQYAIPLLDYLFEKPMLSARQILDQNRAEMPSRQMLMTLLDRFSEAGILKVYRQQSGRRPQIFVFDQLLALCEKIGE